MFRRSNGKEREVVTPESKKAGRTTQELPSVLEMSRQDAGTRDMLPIIVLCGLVLLLVLLVILLLGNLDLEKLLAPFGSLPEILRKLQDTFNELKRLLTLG